MILNDLIHRFDENGQHYYYFFIPELRSILEEQFIQTIEEIFSREDNIINLENYDQKRSKGENDSKICSIIRDDNIKEFISYINRNNILMESTIKSSVYETNHFLIENEPNLIQYAAFYGSIQIFNYLRLNNVDLNPSLWLYVIHSNNAEMIHLLEEQEIEPDDESFQKCYEESIKCHHNEISAYIYDNLLDRNILRSTRKYPPFHRKIVGNGFKYSNYLYFPEYIRYNYIFFYLNEYKYFEIVNAHVKNNEYNLDSRMIIKINFIELLLIFE